MNLPSLASPGIVERLAVGTVIPACPLALTARRRLDERRQRALLRYYRAAGAGGIAIAVHTTQFAIRSAGLLEPVLALAADELNSPAGRRMIRVGGVCGQTPQAMAEATLLRRLQYDAALLSLGAFREAPERELVRHCRTIAGILPVIGFYLQSAVGGRQLSYEFWRRFAEIENAVAIKIAPFNRYQTLDVVRAVADSGRQDLVLYTGNDDHIIGDFITPFAFDSHAKPRRIVGGILGHWAVWTRNAVKYHQRCLRAATETRVPADLLRLNAQVTDANAAFFDARNGFAGCIAGLHEVLRRQGLFAGIWCLDPQEGLSRGQAAEIDRVYRSYPHLNDDDFVAEHRDEWLRG